MNAWCLQSCFDLLLQADIDSAFRRIPVKPMDREYSSIAFKCNGNVVIAQHLAMMFGSVASVHPWERVGENIFI